MRRAGGIAHRQFEPNTIEGFCLGARERVHLLVARMILHSNNPPSMRKDESLAYNKKERERAELHRVIWNIANDLRGSVDG